MNDNDKSRETLIEEIAQLRRELEFFQNRENTLNGTRGNGDCEQCTNLIREVPEYLYSIEFAQGKIVGTFHSPQCREITGYSPSDYTGNPNLWMDMVHECDRERVRQFLLDLREPLYCKSIEHRIIHRDGSVRWVLNMSTAHRDASGFTLRQSGFLIDVSGRREEYERSLRLLDDARHNSFTDDLTQLYNRRAFRVLAEKQLLVAERLNSSVLVLFMDVDKLKYVNDTYGHFAGDALLVELATILKATFRESDIIARLGGDEFAVLSMEIAPDSSDQLLERLSANIEKTNEKGNNTAQLSVSVGVSRYKLNESDSVTGMLERADRDMYMKKLRT